MSLLPAGLAADQPAASSEASEMPAEVQPASRSWQLRISCLACWGSITAALAVLSPSAGACVPISEPTPTAAAAGAEGALATIVWRPTAEIASAATSAVQRSREVTGDTPAAALKGAGWRPQAVLLTPPPAGAAPAGSALRGAAGHREAAGPSAHFPLAASDVASLVALPGTQNLLSVAPSGAVFALRPCSAAEKAAEVAAGTTSPITQAPVKSFFSCTRVTSKEITSHLGTVVHAARVGARLIALCRPALEGGLPQLHALSLDAAQCFTPPGAEAAMGHWEPCGAAPSDAVAVLEAACGSWTSPPPGTPAASAVLAVLTASGAIMVQRSAVGELPQKSTASDLALALGLQGGDGGAGGGAGSASPGAPVVRVAAAAGATGALEVTVGLPIPPSAASGKAPAGSIRQHPPAALTEGGVHIVVKPLAEPLEAALLRGTGRIVKAPDAAHAGMGWLRLSELALGTQAQAEYSQADAAALASAAAAIPGLQPALVPLLGKLLPRNTALCSMWSTGQDRVACSDTVAQQAEFKQRLSAQLQRMMPGSATSPARVLYRGTAPAARVVIPTSGGGGGLVMECVLLRWQPQAPSLQSVGAVQVLARSTPWCSGGSAGAVQPAGGVGGGG